MAQNIWHYTYIAFARLLSKHPMLHLVLEIRGNTFYLGEQTVLSFTFLNLLRALNERQSPK